MLYLAYDVRGIQSFIFAVPRLTYIIGGSALVDRYDREAVRAIAEQEQGADLLFAGGGKGVFSVADQSCADRVQERLVAGAHAVGLDLRIGRSGDYSEAANCADRLFPFLPAPDEMDGHPCQESGLYPLGSNPRTVNERRVNRTVAARVRVMSDPEQRKLHRRYEKWLLEGIEEQHPRLAQADQIDFFHDVDEGSAGAKALGNRNRWAVIAMDGNSIGTHFREQRDLSQDAYLRWVCAFGRALADVTDEACRAAIGEVVARWLGDEDEGEQLGDVVLPIRPLVVGGDDVLVLCHGSYAMDFVQAMSTHFTDASLRHAERAREEGLELWPASGGALTISAGVLFAPTSLPLATAIPYAETILKLAKKKGRDAGAAGQPPPAHVDWESVTEGFLDHPKRRRERTLYFLDGDEGRRRVELTRRPYRMDRFDELRKAANNLFLDGPNRLPGSIAHELLAALRAGRQDRDVFRARVGKHRGALSALLDEDRADGPGDDLLGWTIEKRDEPPEGTVTVKTIGLLDAFFLAQESRRMAWETAR